MRWNPGPAMANHKIGSALAVVSLMVLGTAAVAQSGKSAVVVTPAEMKWVSQGGLAAPEWSSSI